jgi:ABC-type phosphate/phosphonate transport system substrate-binding protein
MNFVKGLMASLVLVCSMLAAAQADEYVFTAPPREKPVQGKELYGPIADFLTAKTGHTFTYKHPDNWLSYMKDMRMDKFDLVFDGPHFVSWRVAALEHTPLVRLPGKLEFVIISRKDNAKVSKLNDLSGKSICGHAPPNLATLTMQEQFKNPARQPRVEVVRGFKNVYNAMVARKCDAAVIPAKVYKKLNKSDEQKQTRVLFQSTGLPHQAISAATRIPTDAQQEMQAALLSPEGVAATEKLRKRFAGGKEMITTNKDEYKSYGYLLSDFWGFELNQAESPKQLVTNELETHSSKETLEKPVNEDVAAAQ